MGSRGNGERREERNEFRGPEDWKRFPDSNATCEIHDPAQAWNALTVGAFIEKTEISDPTLSS